MKQRMIIAILPAGLLLVMAAAKGAQAPGVHEDARSCSVRCYVADCGDDGHKATAGTIDEYDGGSHPEDCADLTCCYAAQASQPCKHPCCDCIGEEQEQLEVLLELVDAEDWKTLSVQVAEQAERVVLNPARGAIQFVSGCDAGVVVANLPIPPVQLAVLMRGANVTLPGEPSKAQ